ncbi:MAG TPA: hypothetical protein VLF62_01585 [Candidatus Saccharimonadales bacterium]|nr:hypothetical protein [Candidatus Saccharimonadales bacterium]
MNRQEKQALKAAAKELKATAKAVKGEAKIALKAAKAKKKAANKKHRSDRIAQIVTVVAVVMATGYILLRVVGWVRFAGV